MKLVAQLGVGLFVVGMLISGCESDDGTKATVDPCANAGCALPPICGASCTATCGCCGCSDGMAFDLPSGKYVCAGGCLAPASPDGGTDSGIDCSRVGCAPPPTCDVGCTAQCGCCPCANGEIQGGMICSGGCFEPLGDAAADAAQD